MMCKLNNIINSHIYRNSSFKIKNLTNRFCLLKELKYTTQKNKPSQLRRSFFYPKLCISLIFVQGRECSDFHLCESSQFFFPLPHFMQIFVHFLLEKT